jgi:hypothetical protein
MTWKPIFCIPLLLACSCGATTDHATTTPPPASASASDDVAYDVHEWGLLRALPGDVLSVGAIAPAVVRYPIAVEKPVLYFHVDAPLTLRSVDVDALGGAIVEAWPSPPRTDVASELRWADVALGGEDACDPSPLPTEHDTACTSLPAGELCETAELARVRATGAACVRVAGTTDTMLFYRARTTTFTPPLTFERTATYAEVRVTNTGDAPIPGWIVRLRGSYGSVGALAVRPPAPHESIVVGDDFAGASAEAPTEELPPPIGSPEPGRRAVRDTLHELGLDDAEADAFFRAWDDVLFGLVRADASEHATEDLPAVERTPPPTESILYFLPEATCEQVSTVRFDPPPRAFHRAFAVWSAL